MMVADNKVQSRYVAYILIALVIITHGVSYVHWNEGFWNPLIKLVSVVWAFYIFTHRDLLSCRFKGLICFLAFYPLVSIFTSAEMYEQGESISLKAVLINFVWFIYFYLHKIKLNEQTIIKAFSIFALIVVGLQVFQQFTYPAADFGVYTPEIMQALGRPEKVDIRNGIYRFRIDQNSYITVVVLLFFLFKLKDKFSIRTLSFVVLMLVSIYLALTRQVMASALFVVVLALLNIKSRKDLIKSFLFIGVLAYVGYTFSDVLFGELSEQTQDEADDDNIRVFSYVFYWDKITENTMTFLFGNGMPGSSGPFKKLMDLWQFDYGYWPVDIGVVGFWFHYGLVYILAFFYANFLFLVRYRKVVPKYLSLTVLFTFLMSIMAFPYWGLFCYFYWPFIFYLYDLHIDQYNLSLESNSCDITRNHNA